MAAESLHSLRFKRGNVEFELTSTAEEVATAHEMLAPMIRRALAGAEEDAAGESEQDGEASQDKPKRKRKQRKQQTATSSAGDERAAIVETLRTAPVDGFPHIGKKPSAKLAGFATLSWAHAELDIDGLTAGEIQAFMLKRRRFKRTMPAYWNALSNRIAEGEVAVEGDPQVFTLMGAGEDALKKELAALSSDE